MDLNQLLSVLLIASTVYQTKGCQEPWELNSEPITDSSMVAYKHFMTVGKKEWLSFSWKAGPQEMWNLDLLFFPKRGTMEGKIQYRKTPVEEVTIPWAIANNEISSIVNSKTIFSKPWYFTLCNRLDIAFLSDETGNWKVKIGEFLLQKTTTGDEKVHSRGKRSEDLGGTDNQPPDAFGFMDDIYDYLFADEDPTTGRKAGIFSHMKTWMKGMACRMGIACEDTIPPQYYPSPPPPLTPAYPDAEPIPADSDAEPIPADSDAEPIPADSDAESITAETTTVDNNKNDIYL